MTDMNSALPIRKANDEYESMVVANAAGRMQGAKVIHKKTGLVAEVVIYTQFSRNKRKALDVLKSLLEIAKLRYRD